MQNKENEKDVKYILLKCDDLYLSILLMPQSLYDILAEILIAEDVDYFWGLHYNELSKEEYEVMRDKLFKYFGKKVNITGSDYMFWLIGSVPLELLPYIKRLKE
jgi:hypothetical protein